MYSIDTCIVCGTDKNLNTEMVINLDGEKVTVKLCDEHAESTTPKAAKEAYIAKKSEIDKIIEQAKKMGLNITIPTGDKKLVVANGGNRQQAEKMQAAMSRPQQKQQGVDVSPEDVDVLPASRVDDVLQNRVGSVYGAVQGGGVVLEGHSALRPSELSEKLPESVTQGLVKMTVAEGRSGQPVAIPAVRKDGTGTTIINIVKGETDASLQRRFKDLAHSAGPDGANVHSFGKNGYAISNCTMCHGDCTIMSKGQLMTCPKCGGKGFLG